MYKETNFNENDPNSNNIDLVFGKILFCLTSALMYDEYLDIHNEIKKTLDKFGIMLKIYTNAKNLLDINFNKLNDIAKRVSTLDYKTITKDGQYLEMADIWLSILISYYNLLKKKTFVRK